MSSPNASIGYRESGYFGRLVTDYLDQKPEIRSLYHRFPTLESFEEQLREKQNFSPEARQRLVEALRRQYAETGLSAIAAAQIEALPRPDTFTITTGHQLSLFTGPLYFVYKIMSAIRLARQLAEAYPGKTFVPVYWMATEDHDFEEISHFNFHGKKFRWNRAASGATGRMSLEGLEAVFALFSQELGENRNAGALREQFARAYLSGGNLAQATRKLVDGLFGPKGLLIVDGDDRLLKASFVPYLKKELFERFSFKAVGATIEKMDGYDIQVNPREINLFYLGDGLRERIVEKEGRFHILNSELRFTPEEMETLVEEHPERISPNVILRPLYQEVILPNLCYIGGGGELAYWLELKGMFEAAEVPFPILLLRNSVLIATRKQQKKAENMGLSLTDLFLPDDALRNITATRASTLEVDFTALRATLQKQFAELKAVAEQTDRSFSGAVWAQERKQLNGLDKLEQRLRKAERRKHQDLTDRAVALRGELFPLGGLQERSANLADFYEAYGPDFLALLEQLDPLSGRFDILIAG